MARRPLADIAFARAGDKGDTADIGVFAISRRAYDVVLAQVTPQRVAALLGDLVRGEVVRYEVPNLLAVKLVCTHALGGGGPTSLRADNLGKALGGAVLRLRVDVPDDVALRERAPLDPYAEAPWVVPQDGG